MAPFHAADAEAIEIDAGTATVLRQAAAAITSLIAERDELEVKLTGIETCACSCDATDDVCMHHSPMLIAAQASHKAARENFLTMQGAAAVLLKRVKALEAIIHDHGSASQIRLATALSSLDTNKGDGV